MKSTEKSHLPCQVLKVGLHSSVSVCVGSARI